MLSPDQLAGVVSDLTGFVWTWEGFDQMDNDTYGYRVLAGGGDGSNVVRPQGAPMLTSILTARRLAQAAAHVAVEQELGSSATNSSLFERIDADTRPEDAAFTEQLAALHWRLFAQRPSAARLEADVALWSAVEALDGPEAAWAALLGALLQDPDLLTY